MATRAPVQKFRGTMAELAAGYTLNGKALSQPFLSQLVTYGLSAAVVDKQANKVGKGKPTNIVELTCGKGHVFAPVVAGEAAEAAADAGSTEVTA